MGTTWGKISEGKFLAGVGSGTDQNSNIKNITPGNNNGSYTHILLENEMPSHTHIPETYPEFPYFVTWTTLGVINRQEAGGDSNASFSFPNQRPLAQRLSQVGGGAAHENTPPGFGVYVWKRLT